MYLSKLKLWNFRKYGTTGTTGEKPGLIVEFKDRLNVLIGENDSGKTAIIDAIRYVLNTKGLEQIRFDEKDFHQTPDGNRSSEFDIECLFSGMKSEEAANFLEWAYFNEQNDYELRVHLKATRHNNNRITYDIKAGPENAAAQMDGNAREFLKVTYLKPLRDAEQELTPSYRSRLAQILLSHEDFKKKPDIDGKLQSHPFEVIIKEANDRISKVLNEDEQKVISTIGKYIKKFLHDNDPRKPELKIANPELQRILKTLSLELEDNTSGLGTLNKLFMAAELLHLDKDQYNGLKLCLIEELEAHLHPQAQLRIVKALEEEESTQIILSTHSTTLGASIKLDHLILCHGSDVYPLWKGKTELEEVNYQFLERFLDATKTNLFFARGVILVEGDAENILIPTIAELIGKPLHKYGVSIVNVGSTAFLHYAKIFMRKDGKTLKIPVAVVTDLDVRAMEYYLEDSTAGKEVFELTSAVTHDDYDVTQLYGKVYESKAEIKSAIREHIKQSRLPDGLGAKINSLQACRLTEELIEKLRATRRERLEHKYNRSPVKVFPNKKWTLEYDIALSVKLREHLAAAVTFAEFIKTNGSYDLSSDDENFKSNVDEKINGANVEEIAYKIFKPFIGKSAPSKAITAQLFAQCLREDKPDLFGEENLSYIINAINYVCEPGIVNE